MDKKKVSDEYVSFMGSWLSGTFVGHFVVKLILWGAAIFGLFWLCPSAIKVVAVPVVGFIALRFACVAINKQTDKIGKEK